MPSLTGNARDLSQGAPLRRGRLGKLALAWAAACGVAAAACGSSGEGGAVEAVGGIEARTFPVPACAGPDAGCAKPRGERCGAGGECGTGFCVDGVCCDSACAGACSACDVAGSRGTCTPVSGAPHGARACGSVCSYASFERGVCGEDHACALAPALACPGGFTCEGDACRTKCASDADCVSGYVCSSGACIGAGLVCADSHTLVRGQGASLVSVDCSPYTCDPAGTCRSRCGSDGDCVEGYTCNPSGRCAEPPPPACDPNDPNGNCYTGCAVAPAPTPGGVGLGVLATALVAVLRARSRSRRGAS